MSLVGLLATFVHFLGGGLGLIELLLHQVDKFGVLRFGMLLHGLN